MFEGEKGDVTLSFGVAINLWRHNGWVPTYFVTNIPVGKRGCDEHRGIVQFNWARIIWAHQSSITVFDQAEIAALRVNQLRKARYGGVSTAIHEYYLVV